MLSGTHEQSMPYPNPFRATTEMELTVSEPGRVAVDIFDALGRAVARLYDGDLPAYRTLDITVPAGDLPSGVFLVL